MKHIKEYFTCDNVHCVWDGEDEAPVTLNTYQMETDFHFCSVDCLLVFSAKRWPSLYRRYVEEEE